MPSLCVIIRTRGPNEGTERLARELAPVFGDDIYLVVDRYEDAQAPALAVDGRQISVGRQFLTERGLPWFPRVGWQCGDFVYYAAAAALPAFDYYFMVEDDVSFVYADKSFFRQMLRLDYDIALYKLFPAPHGWMWTETMSKFYDVSIHHAFFPISCVSRRVIEYLLEKRIEYSARFAQAGGNLLDYSYANDEVFVATTVVNGGFDCVDLVQMFPAETWSQFSLFWPTHPDERSFVSDSILHPVYAGPRAKQRFYESMHLFPEHKPHVLRRLAEYSSRLGEDTWREFSGIDPNILRDDDHVAHLFKVKEPTRIKLEQKFNLRCHPWIFEYKTLAFDFASGCGMMTFDLVYSEPRRQFVVELFAREPAGKQLLAALRPGGGADPRVEVGAFAADIDPSTLADELADVIAGPMQEILELAEAANAAPGDAETPSAPGWRRAASKIWRTLKP